MVLTSRPVRKLGRKQAGQWLLDDAVLRTRLFRNYKRNRFYYTIGPLSSDVRARRGMTMATWGTRICSVSPAVSSLSKYTSTVTGKIAMGC